MNNILIAGSIVAVALLLILLLVGAGMVYQAIGLVRDAHIYPPTGKLVRVNGHRLHLSSSGAGGPVVVMDSGLGHTSLVWSLVQAEVAGFTRVCVYDRAGYGWSEVGPMPRTSQQIVAELHALLANADIPGPYVLVGHSFGGLNMTFYASQYPDEVVGLVLLDTLPKDIQTENPYALRQFSSWNRLKYRALSTMTRLGLFRLFLRVKGVEATFGFAQQLPREYRPLLTASVLRKTFESAAAEATALGESVAIVRAAPPLKDVPLVVLSHGIPDMFTGNMGAQDVEAAERIWQSMQAYIATLSSQGTLIIAEKSGHKIHLDQPEAVIAAIRQVVEVARQQ